MRCIVLLFLAAFVAAAEMSAPLIGYVRDTAGAVRPVYGVAGAFTLGDAVEHGAAAARFIGASGCIVRNGEVLVLRDGRPVEVRSSGCTDDPLPVHIEADEVVIEATGVRLRLPASIDAVERMGEEWYVLRSAGRLFALRVTAGLEAIYQLPEASA